MCYFEVDSLLPLNVPQFAFLRTKGESQTEARIKTIKLKGKFAQGLILPLSVIDEVLGNKQIARALNYTEDEDLTDVLGVKKWEPEMPEERAILYAASYGPFPTFVSKTDETRIQVCEPILTRHKGRLMYIAEKIDGSSLTAFVVPRNTPGLPSMYLENNSDDLIFGLASRNLCMKPDVANSFWACARAVKLEEKLRSLNRPIVLQGELFGPGVQKNKLQTKALDIAWFNAVDPVGRKYLSLTELRGIVASIGMSTVPILAEYVPLDFTVDSLVNYSIGKSTLNANVWREGIVVRPMVPVEDITLGNLSFKVINPQFSVKYDE